MEEKCFYQNGSVNVTQSRFIVGDKTFAMRNISSVQVGIIEAPRGLAYIFIIVGVLLIFMPDARTIGIILAILGGLYLYFAKNKFSVRITTNSGATDGVISTDREFIQKIVNALNEAIIHQG